MNSFSTNPLISDAVPRKKKVNYFYVANAIVLLSAFTLLSMSIYLYFDASQIVKKRPIEYRVDSIVRSIINGFNEDILLPSRYMVNWSFIMPPNDQKNRGTCWDFSSINSLESQYRDQGIRYGFLQSNQYVNFSKQAFGAYLLKRCASVNYEAKPCKHGGLPKNSTDDHKADSIYYFLKEFPDLADSILPESVCNYTENESESDDKECDGMDDALKTNPISFKIKNISYATDVYGVKKLIFNSKRPLIVGAPLPGTNLYIPCTEDSPYAELCIESNVTCPAEYNLSIPCYRVNNISRLSDGTFFIGNNYNLTTKVGGHAMNIVGYNDNWIYASKYSDETVVANLKGAFIVHNSWRNQGHSVEYLMGYISEENEAVICPNHQLSSNWISTTAQCLENNNGDITKCGQNEYTTTKFVRGRGIQTHADLLKCINSLYCDASLNYALMTKDYNGATEPKVEHLKYGNDRVFVLEWSDNSSDISVKNITAVPFAFLDGIFAVKNPVPNHEYMCGYYALPYQVVEIMNQKNWANLDNFHATDIEYEFENRSYLANKQNGYDYQLLSESTYEFDRIEFKSPLPLEYIYGNKTH